MSNSSNRHLAIDRAIAAARQERAEFIGRMSSEGFAALQRLWTRHAADGRNGCGETDGYRLEPAVADCR